LLVALLAAATTFCWQSLTVHYNYRGNWTGLFCSGDLFPLPPQLESEHVYRFKDSLGYDGQVYHYIAHDPFFQRGFDKYIDAPRYRYPRILIPLSVYSLALGHQEFVHGAYIAVILCTVVLGAYWLSAYLSLLGIAPWWGAAFLLVPATLISIDRMTIDVGLAALCIGFVYFLYTNSRWGIYAVLVAAPLVRETGLIFIAGYALYLLWNRKVRSALLFSTAVIPSIAWYLFVQVHTSPYPYDCCSLVPLKGLVERVLHPPLYPFSPLVNWIAAIFDYAALAGVFLAIALAVKIAFERRTGPIEISICLFALMAVFLSFPDSWRDVYGFARPITPLLILLAMSGLTRRALIWIVPIGLFVPRIVLQFGPQLIGVVRGLLS